MRDIVLAHGERISQTYADIHEKLISMRWDKNVSDYKAFLAQVNEDKAIVPNLSEELYDDYNVGNIVSGVADRIVEAETTIESLKSGKRYVENAWVLNTAWSLELLERGETETVTMACAPITMRILALAQIERETYKIDSNRHSFRPSGDWCNNLQSLTEASTVELAEKYINNAITLADTIYDGNDKDMTIHIETGQSNAGHVSSATVEFCPGQVCLTGTLCINENENIYFSDNSIFLPQVMPQALMTSLAGKRLDTIVEHDLFRGLEVFVEEIRQSEDDSEIILKYPQYAPLKMSNPPSWWKD